MLPWKETSVESERLQFIERHSAGEETVAELCGQFGISRKTGYKIIDRYEAYGDRWSARLEQGSPSPPQRHPHTSG